jgi:hypothetical protein
MTLLFSILTLLSAIVAAAYLQLPTFLLALGYRWFHRYKIKRWFFRALTAVLFMIFLSFKPSLLAILLTVIPAGFFFYLSLFNANPKVYIALNDKQIIKDRFCDYTDETEVLGYADENGNAIAYPLLELVKPRHLLNDKIAGHPILISYCMACRSAMVYNPNVNHQRLHFEVLGVYRRNMVMADIETGTIWQQGTGEAIYGKLKGSQLQYLPYQQMTIKEWLLLYPASYIAYESGTVKDGIFSKDRLMKMMKVTETLVAPGKTDLKGLPLREKVFGVQIGNHTKAYPVSELKKITWRFKDYIGENEVLVCYNKDNNHIIITDALTGRQLVAQSHWWFGWKEFHPNTEIWKA